ncbi:MAG: ATP-binding protein [Verrucomicrobiae bacterium]|nr:ATP-binding protein [Verrucomicrobiae bacterium]MDW8309117.1 ATP-binding protein [Verrucomicrobiales bacterium]
MKRRHLTPRLLAALADTPVVFLQGPRQAGKSTLVQSLQSHGHAASYLTLDDAATLAAASADPDGFVAGLPERVILDEVQRVPELFRAIKRSVDTNRKPGRFLLTGSAQVLLLPKVSESLAGRMEVLTLWPFSQGEIAGQREGFVDACFAPELTLRALDAPRWAGLAARISTGGFPEAVARSEESRRHAWFDAYLTTLLERDIRDLANISGLRDLPRLLRLLATRVMGLLNLAELSREAAMPQTTLHRYFTLFEATFLARTLPPWHANLGLRLVKTPKLWLVDTGLLCHLLGIEAARLATDDLMSGPALECFVASELTKQLSWSRTRASLFHYRTHSQQEVDFVLESAAGKLVGIEVKKTASPSEADFKGLRHLAEQTGKRFLRGVLLHTGPSSAAFGKNLYALPVSALWQYASASG